MPRKLERYRQKRDFKTSPEPAGNGKKSGAALSFVVQKHHARRLHYDFRLELDGVLKSWAVPKGPSLDPADKRLAVHVEDHPLDYAGFEGDIPEGHYGAGSVIVWDRGEWIPLEDPERGYREGKLKFELRGEKLHGVWNLVRMRRGGKQDPWLLIKENDEAARVGYDLVEARPDSVLQASANRAKTKAAPKGRQKKAAPRASGKHPGAGSFAAPALALRAKLPASLEPQLATLVADVPVGGEWNYEIKFDGYRLLARLENGKVILQTRNGNDWTQRLPELAAELAQWPVHGAWLDGEIVVLGADGVPSFQALQNAFDSDRTDTIQYFLFDLPFCEGYDLRRAPLMERRAALRELLAPYAGSRVQFSENFEVSADRLLSTACRMHLEGVIGKMADGAYRSGRNRDWVKLKCKRQQEFVIGGFTDPKKSRTGVGALLLGVHEADGSLRYVGKVGSGFNETSLRSLSERLQPLRRPRAPFAQTTREGPRIRGNWVEPDLVAQVEFSQWTRDGLIRQAVFQGLREDKPATAITREPVARAPRGRAAHGAKSRAADDAKTAAQGKKAAARSSNPSVAGIVISHPDRVIDPDSGLTKLELAQYYERVAPHILAQLEGRPVSLTRAPTGVEGELFFQKHADTLKIPQLRRLDRKLFPGHPPLLEIDSLEALIGAAQMNVVEFHTWNACSAAIEKPDRITFDLDPGAGFTWQQLLDATQLTKALLDELGLRCFLKTSGGKGLHIVVPLIPEAGWDSVKRFAHAVTRHLAKTLPTLFVAKSGPDNRIGKVFVDYLRNTRGATTVAAFSARARPGLGVSMPLAWSELPELPGPVRWTVGNTPARLARWRDPWARYERDRQRLTEAMAALGVGAGDA